MAKVSKQTKCLIFNLYHQLFTLFNIISISIIQDLDILVCFHKNNTMRNYFTLYIVFLTFALSFSKDYFFGDDFGVRMTYKEVKKQGFILFNREETLNFVYPERTNITGIACVDLSPEKSGTVTIEDGGIYNNHVKLNLKSGYGKGLKYTVEIYTKSSKIRQATEPINVDIVYKL